MQQITIGEGKNISINLIEGRGDFYFLSFGSPHLILLDKEAFKLWISIIVKKGKNHML